MYIPGPTLRNVLPPGEYDRIYRPDFFCIRHYELSDVAFCHIALALLEFYVSFICIVEILLVFLLIYFISYIEICNSHYNSAVTKAYKKLS